MTSDVQTRCNFTLADALTMEALDPFRAGFSEEKDQGDRDDQHPQEDAEDSGSHGSRW